MFTLTKGVDSFTPTLAQAAITGHPYTSMVITIHSHAAGQQTTVITYELTHVGVVDDHQQFERISHDAPLGTVKELITLRYNTIRCKVGTTTTGWDWVTHSKA